MIEEYLKEAAKGWGKSPSMMQHFKKNVSQVIRLTNGGLVAFNKPQIKKNFCFGYRDSHENTRDYDGAQAMANRAERDIDYFINENMKEETKFNILKIVVGSAFILAIRFILRACNG